MAKAVESKKRVEQELAIRRRAFEIVQSLPESFGAALAVLAFAKTLVEQNLDPEKLAAEMQLGSLKLVDLDEGAGQARERPEARPAPAR